MRVLRSELRELVDDDWAQASGLHRRVSLKNVPTPGDFATKTADALAALTQAHPELIWVEKLADAQGVRVAPPDFAVVDAWAPVADGPFGVMGCDRPAQIRHVYAGADALAVDEAVLADLGIEDARRAPIVRRAHHWFGLPVHVPVVDGERPAAHLRAWRPLEPGGVRREVPRSSGHRQHRVGSGEPTAGHFLEYRHGTATLAPESGWIGALQLRQRCRQCRPFPA
jgi:hypothetical protein